MKTINLTQGYSAIIDDEDYDEIIKYKWHVAKYEHTCYAARTVRDGEEATVVLMHRQLMGRAADGLSVDHINHNGLDNRMMNLRAITASENNKNRKEGHGSRYKYKGVFRNNRAKQWEAYITKEAKPFFLGAYDTPEEAARAYDKEAKVFWGELADLNFP